MTILLLLLAIKSLLVAAATLGLLRMNSARTAAERSTIAHLGLLALVALPLGSLALPTLSLPVPAALSRIPGPELVSLAGPSRFVPAQAPPLVGPSSESRSVASPMASRVTRIAHYAILFPTMILLALTLAALLRLVGLRARAEVLIDPVWLTALARAQRRMGLKNGTALLKSHELPSPVSWGFLRPIILLNDAAVLAPEQAEAIIAHELAHVVQFDWAKLILARVATAAFWFNPLAWALAREAHQLREESADDAVLAANVAGPDYAELLIGVARHQCRGTLLGAHGVAPSKSSLGRRVKRVLDHSSMRGPSGRSWIAGFATGMLSMAVPLAALTVAPGQAALTVNKAEHPRQWHASNRSPDRPPTITTTEDAVATATALAARDSVSGSETRATRYGASAVAQDLRPRQRGEVDQLIGMRAVGVSGEYSHAMKEAGFPNLTADELIGARAVGVTPEYARAMRATGMPINIDELTGARAIGLDPAYIRGLSQLGIKGTFDDYQGMRAVGVTPDFVRSLRKRGINVTSPDKLTSLRTVSSVRDP